MKRPAQRRDGGGSSSRALVSVLRSIPKGQTRTKMEVFRKVLHELGRGDEGIDTGIRTQLGSQLVAMVAKRAVGWHRVVSSDGGFWNVKEQLALLQAEGARPRPGESVCCWAARRNVSLVATYRASLGRAALPRHDPRLDKWRPETVEPLRNKAALKERLALSGGKLFHHPDVAKPQPPAFPRQNTRKKLGKTLKIALKSDAHMRSFLFETRRSKIGLLGCKVRPKLQAHFAEAQFSDLRRTGAVCIRKAIQSKDCAELLHFAASTDFADVRRLDGEAGQCGAYHFCDEAAPPVVEAIRTALYESILVHMPSLSQKYGSTLAELEKRCRASGQRRCATIFLTFGEGGFNLAHQDPYGTLFFPYQAVLMLSKRGKDFNGGEFFVKNVKTGQVAEVAANEGDLIVFAANSSAVHGADFKHGVRAVRGTRFSVGIVFNLRR